MRARGGLIVGILLCIILLPLLASAKHKPNEKNKDDHHHHGKKPNDGKHGKNPNDGKHGKNPNDGKHRPKPPANGPGKPGTKQPNPPVKPDPKQPNPPAKPQPQGKPDPNKPNPQPQGKPDPNQPNPKAQGKDQPKPDPNQPNPQGPDPNQNKAPENPYGGGSSNPVADPTQFVVYKDAEPESQMQLSENYYETICPDAEKIVKDIMTKQLKYDPSNGPALVRLFFHDCFVKGCDASILLDKTPENKDTEKLAPHNGPVVGGYTVIDDIKSHIEEKCPGIVSCADILAFASRDSLVHAGIPQFNILGGRRDGVQSLAENVHGNLPLPTTPINEMIEIFRKKNMTEEEMVILIGAHSIGNAHCKTVRSRFFDPIKSKEIDPGYKTLMVFMTSDCQTETQDVPFDTYSNHLMDSKFYQQLLDNKALVESDHNIAKYKPTRDVMERLVNDQNGWVKKFTDAYIKMGRSAVLGKNGDVRRNCRIVPTD